MGSVYKGFLGIIFGLIFSLPNAFGHDEQAEIEKYQTLGLAYNFGYDAYLDMETFLPAEPPGHVVHELTQGEIKALGEWRSKDGVPWTTWAYEKDLSTKSKASHNMRRGLAYHVVPYEVFNDFYFFLLEQEGITLTEEEIAFFNGTGELPKRLWDEDPGFGEFKLSRWFRKNVAGTILHPYDAVMETFAWYSSGSYKPGSLPEDLETSLAKIGNLPIPEMLKDFPVPIYLWAERAMARLKEKDFDPGQGPYFASPSDMDFLIREERFSQLPYFKDLLEVTLALRENPENFSEIKPLFEETLGRYPGPRESYFVEWGEFLIEDFEKLNSPPEVVDLTKIEDWWVPVGVDENQVFQNLESYIFQIESFIEGWSELQSVS